MASNTYQAGNGNSQLALAERKANSLQEYLEANLGALQMAATSQMDPKRLLRIAVNVVRQTPALAKCSIQSIYKCVMQAAEVGLEFGGALGHCYMIPYGEEAQFIIGYRGLLSLARRSGLIANIQAFAVYEGDEFDAQLGDAPFVHHRPNWEAQRDDHKLRFVYCVARLKDQTLQLDIMTRKDIDRIRQRSRAKDAGPWVTDYAEMARKTVVRRLSKYLPLSIEMALAVQIDEESEFGPLEGAVVETTAVQNQTQAIAASKAPNIKTLTAKEARIAFESRADLFNYSGHIAELACKILNRVPDRWNTATWQEATSASEDAWIAAIRLLTPPAAPEPPEAASQPEDPDDDVTDEDDFDDEDVPAELPLGLQPVAVNATPDGTVPDPFK